MATSFEFMIGVMAIMLGSITSGLLFMRTLDNLHLESTKYLLLVEAWSTIVMFLAGFNIIYLDVGPLTITTVTISLGTLMIAASFVIYDSQKVNYQIKA